MTTVVALAGLDTVDFWRKRGYRDVRVVDDVGDAAGVVAGTAAAEERGKRRKGGSGRGGRAAVSSSASGSSAAKEHADDDVVPLSPQQWALVRDPFKTSKAMVRVL